MKLSKNTVILLAVVFRKYPNYFLMSHMVLNDKQIPKCFEWIFVCFSLCARKRQTDQSCCQSFDVKTELVMISFIAIHQKQQK